MFNIHKFYSLKTKRETYENGGKLGLINKSSICYLNSIVQCLSHTLPMTDAIFNFRDTIHTKDTLVYECFSTLLYKLWNGSFVLDAYSLMKTLKLSDNVQHDSHETLLKLLSCIHDGLKYKIQCNVKGEELTESDILLRKGYEAWIKYFGNDYSFIIKNFYGDTITTYSCKCNEPIFEPFNNIMLPIDDSDDDIETSFTRYFQQSKCASCIKKKKKHHGTIDTEIWNLPDTFIITLKRFDNQGKKINKAVNFPFDLDMTRWVSKAKGDPNNYIYSLYAVNCHIGRCDNGHYWSYCKDIHGDWYKFDDTDTVKVNDMSNINTNSTAYILFYQRVRIL